MKQRWPTKKLGDVCLTIQDGAHESPQQRFDTPDTGRFLYITSKNIRNDYLDLSKVSYVNEDFHNRIYARCRPSFGDVLLTKDGANTGNVTLNTLNEPFSLLSSVCLVKTKPDALIPGFLSYFIQSPDGLRSITGQMTGAAIKRIVLRDIKLATIPLPTVAEQHRIVGLLDEALSGLATAKANADKNLQSARDLLDSHLQSVFTQKGNGWVEKRLGDLCDGVEYGSSAKSKRKGRVPVLRMGNIQNGKLDWTNLLYSDDSAEIERYSLKHNDVLFNRTNSLELVGKAAIYKSEMPAIFAGYLIRIHRKKDLLDGDYLNYFLNSRIALDYGKTVAISSVNQANINGEKLKSYPIPVPPLAVQAKVVTQLDALSSETGRLESIYRQKLAALDALKKSLLHQAFSGAL